MTRVVAVNGSRRDGSYTRIALGYALDAAADAGATTDCIDLSSVDLPLYHPDRDASEQGEAAALLERMRAADGVVLGSPVYHDSYSSTLKNFHDYCSFDEYENTVTGLLAVAGGGSYGSTLGHMRSTVRGVHGWVLPHQVGITNSYDRFDDGRFVDAELQERTEKLGRLVAAHATRFSADRKPEMPADD